MGFQSLEQTRRPHEDIQHKLDIALDHPEVAVELSQHIPALLAAAARDSANLLNGRQPGVVGQGYPQWHETAHLCIEIIDTLSATSRLPQQDVLDTFKSPGAGALPQAVDASKGLL